VRQLLGVMRKSAIAALADATRAGDIDR
jgi:hypothetical protein